MKKNDKEYGELPEIGQGNAPVDALVPLILKVRPDLYRAFHRCSWILIHETGRDQLDIMEEMVEDFLIKHQC